MNSEERGPEPTLLHYLGVLSRRKWVIVLVLVLLPATAFGFESAKPAEYAATAQVLLGRQNIPFSLAEIDDPTLWSPDRTARTQAEVAHTPAVAERVLARAGLEERSATDLLDATGISASEQTDILEFTVVDRDRQLAARLATAYAREYISYRLELDTLGLRQARESLEEQIAALGDDVEGDLQRLLVEKREQLRTAEALQSSNAYLIRSAGDAAQIAPRPARVAAVALVLALVLGLGLSFLWEAIDTRLRRSEDIASLLSLPLLARLIEPPRPMRRGNRLVMLEAPDGIHADAFRTLRMNIEFMNKSGNAGSILITSAVDREGKSTTLANLAVSLAQAGYNVILVDLDLRRATQHSYFRLRRSPGVSDVLTEGLSVDDALRPIAVARGSVAAKVGLMSTNGRARADGTLRVLTAGSTSNPGELASASPVGAMLKDLRERADFVLVDGPPILLASDALAISRSVDAVLLVARLGSIRRPMISNVRRALDSCPAEKLGLVVTGAGAELREEGSYFYYSYTDSSEPGRVAPEEASDEERSVRR